MLTNTLFSLLFATAVNFRNVEGSAITDCLTKANVPQNLPGSSDFTQAIKPFNLRLPFTPVAVAVPTTVPQVQAAVKCGVDNKVIMSPKSGGHSYASQGLGGEDGHMIVDMKMFNTVTVNTTTQIAAVGIGSRLGNVAQALYSQGKRAISHGTCPGVGVGGHVGGGGYGYISHTKGLALDNLVGATVVIANGTVLQCSNTTNSDLFWALRGGGNAMGVITEWQFQTFPAPDSNTVYSMNFNFNSAAQAAKMHAALATYANTSMPLAMNTRMFVTNGGFQLEGVYYGSQADYHTAIAPLFTLIGQTPASQSVSTMNWINGLSNYAYMPLTQPLNYNLHETFFSKSLMTAYLSPDALNNFWTYYFNTATKTSRDWYLIIDLHGGPNSAIGQVPADATSYAHRDALLKYEFYDRVDYGSYPSNGFSFLNGWVGAILNTMNTTQFGMYLNYADTSLTRTQATSAYYMGHYPRLAQIKKVYDPNMAFSNPQAVWTS